MRSRAGNPAIEHRRKFLSVRPILTPYAPRLFFMNHALGPFATQKYRRGRPPLTPGFPPDRWLTLGEILLRKKFEICETSKFTSHKIFTGRRNRDRTYDNGVKVRCLTAWLFSCAFKFLGFRTALKTAACPAAISSPSPAAFRLALPRRVILAGAPSAGLLSCLPACPSFSRLVRLTCEALWPAFCPRPLLPAGRRWGFPPLAIAD